MEAYFLVLLVRHEEEVSIQRLYDYKGWTFRKKAKFTADFHLESDVNQVENSRLLNGVKDGVGGATPDTCVEENSDFYVVNINSETDTHCQDPHTNEENLHRTDKTVLNENLPQTRLSDKNSHGNAECVKDLHPWKISRVNAGDTDETPEDDQINQLNEQLYLGQTCTKSEPSDSDFDTDIKMCENIEFNSAERDEDTDKARFVTTDIHVTSHNSADTDIPGENVYIFGSKELQSQPITEQIPDQDPGALLPGQGAANDPLVAHICSICSQTYKYKASLHKHMFSHSDARPHLCDTCGKKFRLQSSLKEHKKLHLLSTRYMCDKCGKVYRSRGSLFNHKTFEHGESSVQCNVCGKHLRRYRLNEHIRSHAGLKEQCPQCNKKFLHLENHLKTCGKKDRIGVHACQACDKSFKEKRYLREHMLSKHLTPDRYRCQTCGGTFTYRKTFNEHKKTCMIF